MKKYLLMTTCLMAGLYALPAHAFLAPTPNVWEFYGADADGVHDSTGDDESAALDGADTLPHSNFDTNLDTKTYLDQLGGYGISVTGWWKSITGSNGIYSLSGPYLKDSNLNRTQESLLENNRGTSVSSGNGDAEQGIGIETPVTLNSAYNISITQSYGVDDVAEFLSELNFNELVEIDLGVDFFTKYKDLKIQFASMVAGSDNVAKIYTTDTETPDTLGSMLTSINNENLTLLTGVKRYLWILPTNGSGYFGDNWDVNFLLKQLSATPIPTDTPEPGILGLLGFALAGLAYVKNRKQG